MPTARSKPRATRGGTSGTPFTAAWMGQLHQTIANTVAETVAYEVGSKLEQFGLNMIQAAKKGSSTGTTARSRSTRAASGKKRRSSRRASAATRQPSALPQYASR